MTKAEVEAELNATGITCDIKTFGTDSAKMNATQQEVCKFIDTLANRDQDANNLFRKFKEHLTAFVNLYDTIYNEAKVKEVMDMTADKALEPTHQHETPETFKQKVARPKLAVEKLIANKSAISAIIASKVKQAVKTTDSLEDIYYKQLLPVFKELYYQVRTAKWDVESMWDFEYKSKIHTVLKETDGFIQSLFNRLKFLSHGAEYFSVHKYHQDQEQADKDADAK